MKTHAPAQTHRQTISGPASICPSLLFHIMMFPVFLHILAFIWLEYLSLRAKWHLREDRSDLQKMFPVISVAPVRNGYVSDKSIDFPMMHSYGTLALCGADSIRCSTMFTQVAVRQLTDQKIRAGCGSEFLQASDGAGGRAGEDLMCCCLCVILHLLTDAGLCAKSISVDNIRVPVCVNVRVCVRACGCVSLVVFWRRGWAEVKSYSAQGCSQSH